MVIKLKDILPNPFRDVKRNPLDEAKVAELESSINDTGFWDNVVVRKTKAGYELAYGHHRIAAAIRAGITEADFIVKDLDDAMMLKIMARENSETYKYSVLALIESVRGVVEALADGRIPAFEIDPKTRLDLLRNAPSYTAGVSSSKLLDHPYTTASVGKFLGYKVNSGMTDNAVIAALNALELIQSGILTEKAIQGLKIDQLLTMTRDIKKRTEARSTENKKIQAEVQETTAKLAKLDADRHVEERQEKVVKAELVKREIEAHREEDDKEAKRIIAERKKHAEQAAARELAFKASRARLDAKVKEANDRIEAAKKQDKDLPTRYAVKTMLFKLNTIVSERNSFREEIKSLSKDKAVTTNEREIIRQAMIDAGDWYIEESNKFLPTRRAK